MWEEFTTALIRRFGGTGGGTVFEKLASLKQTGSVDEYVQEFELLVARATNTAEEQMLGYFLTGLSHEIQGQVHPHDLQDVVRAMEVARDVEEALKGVRSYGVSSVKSVSTGFRYQGSGGIVSRGGTFGNNNSQQYSSGGAKNL